MRFRLDAVPVEIWCAFGERTRSRRWAHTAAAFGFALHFGLSVVDQKISSSNYAKKNNDDDGTMMTMEMNLAFPDGMVN